MAAELSPKLGKPLTAQGVRQSLHRARKRFVDLLIQQVAGSLHATDSHAALQAQLRSYYNVMFGVQGLFMVTPEVTRDVFGRYVANLDLTHRAAGLRAISYGQHVPATAKDAFVKRVRGDASRGQARFARFDVKPPGERPEYVVLVYTEPLEENEPGLGLDLIAYLVGRRYPVDVGDIMENVPSYTASLEEAYMRMTQGAVDFRSTAAQRAGLEVARVHSGDPSFYGAIGEQMRRRSGPGSSIWLRGGTPRRVSAPWAGSIPARHARFTCPGVH